MATRHFHFSRTSVLIAATALLAAGLLLLVAAEKPAKAAFPGKNGLIVFTSDRDTPIDPNTGQPYLDSNGNPIYNDELYAMNSDGSKTIRLTTDPAVEQWPALSPDGTKVAFQSWPDSSTFSSGSEIYKMDVDDNDGDGNGDNRTQLTNNSTWDSKPAWSPDGRQIAFYSLRRNDLLGRNDYDIFVMDAEDDTGPSGEPDGNGDNLRRLTNSLRFDGLPAWSPDGSKIAFVSGRTDAVNPNPELDAEIYVMDADGSNLVRLTNNSLNDGALLPGPCQCLEGFWSQLAWSPDGSKIAFQRWESDGNVDIHVVKTDGSGRQTNLTNTAAADERYPAWSPDGTKIAFWKGFLDPKAEIYVMKSNGSGTPTNLINNKSGDIQPDWGPLTENQCDKDLVAGVAPERYSIFEVLGFASEDECRIEAGG